MENQLPKKIIILKSFYVFYGITCEKKMLSQPLLIILPQSNTNNIIIINYCIIFAKHFIYRKKINNANNINFRSYLSLLKRHLLIEREIWRAQS